LRIVGIVSAKGGVGKTTVATNFSIALQKLGNSTVLIDCNFTTAHLGLFFNLFNVEKTLNTFLRGECDFNDVIYKHYTGLSIIPSSIQLEEIAEVNIDDLKTKIKEKFSDSDFVVLDSAPGLGREAIMTIKLSDEIIVVANPTVASIVDAVKVIRFVNLIDPRKKVLGIVLNKIRNKKYEIPLEKIESFTGIPIIGRIPEDDRFIETTNRRTPFLLLYPDGKISENFYQLASFVSGMPYYKRKGVLNFLLNFFKRNL